MPKMHLGLAMSILLMGVLPLPAAEPRSAPALITARKGTISYATTPTGRRVASIDLRNTQITNAEIQFLVRTVPHIGSLDLSSTPISGLGFRALRELKDATHLYLFDTGTD